ncbi:hypothetical protein Mapa_011549 [Marchantia paleacea]|nr:hypothetical protein Mapa_011549 [Marchantia paleacea]
MGHGNLLSSFNLYGDCCFIKSQQQPVDLDLLDFEFAEPTSVLDLTSCISPPLQEDVWAEQTVQFLLEEEQQQTLFYSDHQQQLLRSGWEYQEQNQLQAEQMSLLASSIGENVAMVWEQEPACTEFDSWGFQRESDTLLESLSSSTLPHLELDDELLKMESWIYGSDGSSVTDDHDSSTALIDMDESSSSVDAASSCDDHTPLAGDPSQHAVVIQQQQQQPHNAHGKFALGNSFLETAVSKPYSLREDFPGPLMISCVEKNQRLPQPAAAEISGSSSSFEVCPIASASSRQKDHVPHEAAMHQWLRRNQPFTEPKYNPQDRQALVLDQDLPLPASDVQTPPSPSHHIYVHPQATHQYQWNRIPLIETTSAATLSSSNLTDSPPLDSSSSPWQSQRVESEDSAMSALRRSHSSPSSSTSAGAFHGGMITQLDVPQGVGRLGVEIRNARARMDAAAGGCRANTYRSCTSSSSSSAASAFDTRSESGSGGVQMVQLLLACAEAVACRDSRQAALLLQQLQRMASPYGDSMQRVTSCFVEGLTARLAIAGSQLFDSSNPPRPPPTQLEKDEGFRLMYTASPYVAFGHYAANCAILEAFDGEVALHIVDLGMNHGLQWPSLIQRLSTRTCGRPKSLRITAYGLGPAADSCKLDEVGRELATCAALHGVPFEFRVVTESLENLRRSMLELRDGEALAVNSMLQLHCVVKESRGSLNAVLQSIHELAPKILTLVEQNASHNGPFFLGRFMEALHYYSAIFDSLDAVLPRFSHQRVKMEQFHFAEEIKNIVSCEGPARVERHERIDQWRRRMSRAGYQPLPLKFLNDARVWLSLYACDGYTLAEEKGCLVLGWKGKPLIAASSWRC